MNARVPAIIALALLSTATTAAFAGNYAYFDRPDCANLNSHAALSNDSYVRSFAWAWGDLTFAPDQSAPHPDARQARESAEPRDPLPTRGPADATPPRHRRDKISMT
ncbi:hypothetical protein D3C81_1146670 [compost metagenome]|uniref:hypothetical protein n=1 Tax=Cupriavidus TaxID=106589 RepID=UPI000FA42A30|nr:hypothetical protein [Cupriavidus campinensis]